jgi:hypothetical protein
MTAALWTRVPSERLASAFRRGDAARDQHRIRPAAHMLYEHLVRFAGERDWCWPGEERLATQMDCSISTIKRMLRELVEAGLITRARRLNRSSLTYITAYLHAECVASVVDITDVIHSSDEDGAELAADASEDTGALATGLDEIHARKELFFGTTDEPSVGPETNQVIDLKNHHSEGLVDGGDFPPGETTMVDRPAVETATVQALRNAGVVDPGVLTELAHQPLTRVERAIRSVDRVRRADDPRRPGLIVHILRHTRHISTEEQKQQGGDDFGHTQPLVGLDQQAVTPPSDEDSGTELVVLWQNVLAHIEPNVPSDEFRTWLQPTSLLEVDVSAAVVATPNVFVRDMFIERYASMVSYALASEAGCQVELVVVIG